MLACAGVEPADQEAGLRPFERLTKASVEGLRYRAEDIARSLTKSCIKEAGPCLHPLKSRVPMSLQNFMCKQLEASQ